MGQRFTIDAAIMQQLIYHNVQQNSFGDNRMLPDVLDVPAALLVRIWPFQILTQQAILNIKIIRKIWQNLKKALSPSPTRHYGQQASMPTG